MKQFNLLIQFFFLLVPLLGQSSVPATNDLLIPTGQFKILPMKSQKVWIQDRGIVQLEPFNSTLKIKGLQEGATLLQVDKQIFKVQVLHPLSLDLYQKMKPIIEQIPGLKLQMRQGRVDVSGHLYRWKDWKKLSTLVDENISYRMRANISQPVQKQVEFEIQKMLEKNGLRPQKIIFAEFVELRLSEKHPDLEELRKLLSPFGISFILDKNQIQTEPTIKVQITVAEVQKDSMRSWGIDWPTSVTAALTPQLQLLPDPIEVQLSALEVQGQGRVLASPNLICQSGQEAEFMAGGEFPVKFVNYKVKEVIWKKYGIFLKVKPIADSSGRMTIKIETEISSINQIIDGIPSLLTHRVSSTFDMNESRTIILSGLLKEQSHETSSGLPFLSQIPVLGPLFSSQKFLNERTELLVFVKPEILANSQYMQPNAELKHLTKGTNQ